jgi:hypothetical protein
MTDIIKNLLLGTDATGSSYHTLMQSVTVHSMRQRAGYVAPVMDTVQREFTFLHTSSGKVGFSVRECTVFRLSPEFWIEVVFPVDNDMKLRYPNVLVFNDSVVFCWSDAMEISYEWCQLEVTRECLIELWGNKAP